VLSNFAELAVMVVFMTVIAMFRLNCNDRLSLAIFKAGAVLPYYYKREVGRKRPAALPSTGLVILISADKH
jgi:hypothetical protein